VADLPARLSHFPAKSAYGKEKCIAEFGEKVVFLVKREELLKANLQRLLAVFS